jgi:hypothetical protein
MPVSVLPDPNDVRAIQAWVDVIVDDATIRMLLDTGSRRSAIPVTSASSSSTGEPGPSGRGVSGAAGTTKNGVARQLSLPCAHRFDELAVEVQPVGWPHPPLLGRDVFQGRCCDFRLAAGVIEIDPVEGPDRLVASASWQEHAAPSVPIRWGDTVVDAVWDTGAGITIVDQGWAEAHPEAIVILDKVDHGTDVTGTAVAGVHGRMHGYAIADLTFPEQACGVVDLSALNAEMDEPIRIILGLPQIVLANWYLDFRSRNLSVYSRAEVESSTRSA